ncbi:MAG: MmgE/PrpD family protein, partial [Burkholderiales bacterium]
NAVFAAMLAARGMIGPAPIFEGAGGYFKAVARVPFALPAMGGREHPFKIMECSIKRFPLGQYSQTVAQAALEVRAKIKSVDDIAEVRIQTLGTAVRIMANDPEKWEPETRETADHSMPYTAAVALIHGAVEESHFDDGCMHDPRVRALTRLVKVGISEEADRRMPEAMLCQLTVVTKSGASHTAEVAYHKGHWKNAMSDAEIEAKFRPLAAKVLTAAQTDRLLGKLWRLEDVTDAGELVRLTVAN